MTLTGEEFNRIYKGVKFVKLTTTSCIHNGYEFKEGLNIDKHPLKAIEMNTPGGFCFCKYEDYKTWLHYKSPDLMMYMWDVTVPDDATVFVMNFKSVKIDKFILSNKRTIWDNEELHMDLVEYDPNNLKYIENKTEKLCMVAAKQNGVVIRWIENQTEKVCMEAVKQNGLALKWVKNQTNDICNAALAQTKKASIHVKIDLS